MVIYMPYVCLCSQFPMVTSAQVYVIFLPCVHCVGDCEEALPIFDMLVATKNYSLVSDQLTLSFPFGLFL